jgi:hypothetical protein
MNKNFMKGKKGWIRIVEAFVAILLITGVVLIVINRGYLEKDISEDVYKNQIEVLREIQLDEKMRSEILAIDETKVNETVRWEEIPQSVQNKILYSSRLDLNCTAAICFLDKICALEKYPEKDVYSRSVAIAANLTDYNPRQLKLFCWVK